MCLIVDRREPEELVSLLRRHSLEVTVMELEYGDLSFSGQGPDGECMIGCERKRLSDLINSMKDRRLSGHQVRGLSQCYDFCFLFVEGVWRPGAGGEIEELRGRDWRPLYSRAMKSERTAVSYRQLLAYLTSLELRGGLVVRRTGSVQETAAQYVALWHWFNDKEWRQHHSHDQIYTAANKNHGAHWAAPHEHDREYRETGRGRPVTVLENPTTAWRWAAALPGIDRRAEVVAKHFGSAREMANAGEKEWMRIDFGVDQKTGRRRPGIGRVTARAVVRAITESGG